MCNLYTQTKSPDEIARFFAALQMPLAFPEGVPNLAARDVCITDSAPVVRAAAAGAGFGLVMRRWSWPGPGGKPVYNFRADGRSFGSGRVLIPADGFYEFTAPADPKSKRKDRWLFTNVDEQMLGIAGIVRSLPEGGEAFTMLTRPPGPDVAPYHNRQIAVLSSASWRPWLDGSGSSEELLQSLPAGTLSVRRSDR